MTLTFDLESGARYCSWGGQPSYQFWSSRDRVRFWTYRPSRAEDIKHLLRHCVCINRPGDLDLCPSRRFYIFFGPLAPPLSSPVDMLHIFIKIGRLTFFAQFWNPQFTEKFLVSNFDESIHTDCSRYALSGGDVYLHELLESAPW